MPVFAISQSPYFDTVGPFDRPLTHLVIESTADDGDPPPPLTKEPGEQWLCLIWSLMGGRQVGVYATSDEAAYLATMARTNVDLISELRRWMKATKRALRSQRYLDTGFTLWVLPAPFPRETPMVLQELALLKVAGDDAPVDVIQPAANLRQTIDQLFDLGAMFWRLEPGHQVLRLETRFVGRRDLERHLESTARMAGIDLVERA